MNNEKSNFKILSEQAKEKRKLVRVSYPVLPIVGRSRIVTVITKRNEVKQMKYKNAEKQGLLNNIISNGNTN